MQAEVVRTRWYLAGGAVAAGALALSLAGRTTVAALPPLTDTDVALAPFEPSLVVRDTAHYVLVDLDQDGVDELVAVATGIAGPELVVLDARHARIAEIPFGMPGNPCASEMAAGENQLIVTDYLAPELGDGACQYLATHHYRLHAGRLVESLVHIDF